jgi:CRISPR-associated exonuclease Cas4
LKSAEADLLPLSGLQHVVFCARQCALIHVEGVFTENRFTLEGRHLHERVDDASTRSEEGYRVARAMPLVSHRLGVFGIADVVEFHPIGGATAVQPEGVAPSTPIADVATTERRPPGTTRTASWPPKTERPYPVEYKRGRRHHRLADQVQLCAQAMALEEMFGCEVPEGALFYNASKRRQVVPLDATLRESTVRAAKEFHRLVRERLTPPPVNDDRCDDCSLRDWCLPGVVATPGRVERYLHGLCTGSIGLRACDTGQEPTPPQAGTPTLPHRKQE